MRIRSVKPEFFSHPEVVRVSIPARLLLISLFTQADDEGRLYDQPRKIGGIAFGEDDDIDAEQLLTELAEQGRIVRYETAGKRAIQVVNFLKHQRVNRASKSVITAPRRIRSLSGKPHPLLTENSLSPHRRNGSGSGSGTGKGMERKGSTSLASDKPPRRRDEVFEAFCEVTNNDWHDFSEARRKEINGMLKFLKTHGGDSPGEIRNRAGNWPFDVAITPEGFVKHWASLSKPRAARGGPGSRSLDLAARLREEGR